MFPSTGEFHHPFSIVTVTMVTVTMVIHLTNVSDSPSTETSYQSVQSSLVVSDLSCILMVVILKSVARDMFK